MSSRFRGVAGRFHMLVQFQLLTKGRALVPVDEFTTNYSMQSGAGDFYGWGLYALRSVANRNPPRRGLGEPCQLGMELNAQRRATRTIRS